MGIGYPSSGRLLLMRCVSWEGSRPPWFLSGWNLNCPLNAGPAKSATEQSRECDGLQLGFTLSLCRDTVTMGWVLTLEGERCHWKGHVCVTGGKTQIFFLSSGPSGTLTFALSRRRESLFSWLAGCSHRDSFGAHSNRLSRDNCREWER